MPKNKLHHDRVQSWSDARRVFLVGVYFMENGKERLLLETTLDKAKQITKIYNSKDI